MNCPECGSKTIVTDTRSDRSKKIFVNLIGTVHRVRHCSKCGHRQTTVEIPRKEYDELWKTSSMETPHG